METPRHSKDDLPPPLEVTAGALAVQVAGLREELAAQGELFTRGIAQLDKRKGSRWAVFGSYGLWLIDIAIIIFVGVTGYNVKTVVDRLQHQQTQISVGVKEQCNFLDLFLGLRSDAARERYEQGPAAYDAAYARLQGSYTRLDCARR